MRTICTTLPFFSVSSPLKCALLPIKLGMKVMQTQWRLCIETTISIAYSVISCGNNSEVRFRCSFGDSNITSPGVLNENSKVIECVKPYFIPQNNTIPITLRNAIGDSVISSISSIYHEDWNEISLVTPLSVRVEASLPSPAICSILDETCSDCGVCSMSGSATATKCYGTDAILFGKSSQDCEDGAVMDREGTCCSIEDHDCRGTCYGSYADALDSTGSYHVCCLKQVNVWGTPHFSVHRLRKSL